MEERRKRTRHRKTEIEKEENRNDSMPIGLVAERSKPIFHSAITFFPSPSSSDPSEKYMLKQQNLHDSSQRHNPSKIPFYLDSSSDDELVKIETTPDIPEIPDISMPEEDSDNVIKGINENWSSFQKPKAPLPPKAPSTPNPSRPRIMRSFDHKRVISDVSEAVEQESPQVVDRKSQRSTIQEIERHRPRIKSSSVPPKDTQNNDTPAHSLLPNKKD